MLEAIQKTQIEAEDWTSGFSSQAGDWLAKIEKDNPMDTISDITKGLFQQRSEIMGQAALHIIERKYGHLLDQKYCNCPKCIKNIKAKPQKVKREIETTIGPVALYRPYFYCNNCNLGFYPLDEALGISSHRIQGDIEELEVWLASEMPYETACETLERCSGIKLSNHHTHDTVNKIADDIQLLDVCPTKTEIQQTVEAMSKERFRRPILMIGVDGAHAPTRPEPSPRKGKRGKGEWKEVKGFRMYLIDNGSIVHLISWHQIKTDKELANDLLTIKHAGLIPEDKVRICVIGDGAPWIWNRIKEVYPSVKKVLDFYHCGEYLHALANAQYGKKTQHAREWIEATYSRLFMNNPDRVIAGMKRMKPTSDDAKEQIDKTIRYLSERIEMLNYGALKRGGYHIGSGGIESSNKFIANVRLKRSGAWWYPKNANNILKLRCAKYNKTFDRVMEKAKSTASMNDTQNNRYNLQLIVDNS